MDRYALYHAIHFLVGERVVRCVAEGEREAEAKELGNHNEWQRECRIIHSLKAIQKPEAWISGSGIRGGGGGGGAWGGGAFQLGEEVQVVFTCVGVRRDIGDG